MEKLHYEERLKRLGLMGLDRRRVRCDLLEAFKIGKLNGLYDLTSCSIEGAVGHQGPRVELK